ncbi:MAG: hypothetical protein ACREIL_10235, partial [Nitrospiraceae bacterium]
MTTDSATGAAPSSEAQRSDAHPALVRLTLALIKTMLRSSYYAPGHPEAKKGLTDLHSEFVLLMGDRAEL